MSAKATAIVWTHSKAKAGSLLVLLAIADHAHEDGDGAYPSIDTVARFARMSTRGAQEAVRALEKLGELDVDYQAGPRGTNVYRIRLPGTAAFNLATPAESAPPPQDAHPAGRRPQSAPEPRETKGGGSKTKPLPQAAPEPKKARPRDQLWDAFAAELPQPATGSERGRWNAAIKQLRSITDAKTGEVRSANAGEVRSRCREYRRRWPDLEMTPTAIAANWTSLGEKPKSRYGGSTEEANTPRCDHGYPIVEDETGYSSGCPKGCSDADVVVLERKVAAWRSAQRQSA